MKKPTMFDTISAAPDTAALVAYVPVPGFGVLAANAFVIHGAEPVLVDTGVVALKNEFMTRLAAQIRPEELRWIWLTHADPDHIGSLFEVLEAAPRARVVTTFLGLGKIGLIRPLPPERVYLLNPGQSLELSDRRLRAIRPPAFDAPETLGLFDEKTRTLFSVDCFGTLLAEPCESAASLRSARLREGLVTWTSIDTPWLRSVDASAFERASEALAALEPNVVLSSHLPPAPGMLRALLRHLASARTAPPVAVPDQHALMETLGAA